MSDARRVFHDLHALSGGRFDSTDMAHGADRVERRVARWRGTRAALTSVVSIAAIAAVVVGVNGTESVEPLPASSPEPAVTAPATPVPDALVTEAADPPGCAVAEVVSWKAVGNLGGLEGWFNGTPVAPCSEWEPQILDHPDTVLIYTGDNTMVEAYYRTSIEALGPYADLGPDFVVPDPDPEWPADSLVLIDARTGEMLQSQDVPEEIPESLGTSGDVSERLLVDSGELAARLEDFASGRAVPPGYRLDFAGEGAGTGSDLATPLFFEREGDQLDRVVVRLVPGDGTTDSPGDATVLDMGANGDGSVLFDTADEASVQLNLPIGDDATLLVVGDGPAAEARIVRGFAREILAE